MAVAVTKICRPLLPLFSCVSIYFSSSIHSLSSQQFLEQSIKASIEANNHHQIADLLDASKETCQTFNPFSFLSNFHQDDRTKIIDKILQSFVSIRPRSRPRVAYSCLLSFTLQTTNPLPLSLAILQRTLRSGCAPVPQTHLLLATAWLHQRKQPNQKIPIILMQMHTIGYRPDIGVCNYLISSLCKVDQHEEAVQVLRRMGGAGCVPDVDSYGCVISPLCDLQKTKYVEELTEEMVSKSRLSPRKEMVVKILNAMRANKDVHKAVGMISFLEEKHVQIGFESYALVVQMCLESGLFVLAGKMVMSMTSRGFIPCIKVRQKVFEGLVYAGEPELAYVIRKKFSDLNS